jgi:hypothetical protein
MQSYLMSQGLWLTMSKSRPRKLTSEADKEATADDVKENKADIDKYDENNNKALGAIRLRLHRTLQFKFRAKTSAAGLWTALEEEYGKPGVIATYLQFKAAMDVRILENVDPSLAIDKFASHFGHMAEAEVEIPDHVQAMILLAKLPRSLDSFAQLICQTEDIKEITMAKVRRGILLGYEQKGNRQPPPPPRNNQAQKISAVKRGPNEPPFQQQQQGEGSDQGSSWRGRRKRGGRGGRG